MRMSWLIGIGGAIVVVGLTLWGPQRDQAKSLNLPWQIELTENGGSRVFGVNLGSTTLGEAEATLGEAAKISLFKLGEKYVVEGYFEEVKHGGLRGKMVMAVQLPEKDLVQIYERGLRVSGLPSGSKVTLQQEDFDLVKRAPVSGITYLPGATIEAATLKKRFGEPAEQLQEAKTEVVHYLYPRLGLDIAVQAGQRPILQYVSPREFFRLEQPLKKLQPKIQQ